MKLNKIIEFAKINKVKIIVPVLIATLLTVTFFATGVTNTKATDSTPNASTSTVDTAIDETNYSNIEETSDSTASTSNSTEATNSFETQSTTQQGNSALASSSNVNETVNNSPIENNEKTQEATEKRTEQDKYKTDPVPQGKPEPVEPEEQETKDTSLKCTISIDCKTILDNMENLDPEKVELVPEDGWILKPVTVTFKEGESVFDVLQRVCKDNSIHMESSWTPIYNSAYIEGINNLYEFDCGSLSGWMYNVNDWFPNYGCSRYVLKDNDVIQWRYTCNLGYDVGGGYSTGN